MADILEYECPRCGGRLEFDAASQQLKCPFCDSVFSVQEVEELFGGPEEETADAADTAPGTQEIETSGAVWGQDESGDMRVYGCNSCGAEIVTDATTAATTCPYCDNVVVMKGQFAGGLKPDLVIPFRFTKDQAVARFKEHINSRKYVPRVFSANNHPDEIKGVYVPFWLFDATARANIFYNAQKTRNWSDGKFNYTETSYYRVHRAGTIDMARVPVNGSTKMADDLMESIEPYKAEDAVPFTTAYLAGYLADRYDIDYANCAPVATDRMKRSAEQAFRNTVTGYTAVTAQSSNVSWNKGRVSYALYPVWLLNTVFEGKKYTFAMNGQTGKFVGDLPLDNRAFNLARLRFAGIFAAVIFVVTSLIVFI